MSRCQYQRYYHTFLSPSPTNGLTVGVFELKELMSMCTLMTSATCFVNSMILHRTLAFLIS